MRLCATFEKFGSNFLGTAALLVRSPRNRPEGIR